MNQLRISLFSVFCSTADMKINNINTMPCKFPPRIYAVLTFPKEIAKKITDALQVAEISERYGGDEVRAGNSRRSLYSEF